jgi:hypothetical protein
MMRVTVLVRHVAPKARAWGGLIDPALPELQDQSLVVTVLVHRVAPKARAWGVLIDPALPELQDQSLVVTVRARLPRVGHVRQQAIAHRFLAVRANLLEIRQN